MEQIQIYDSINNKHITVFVAQEVAKRCSTDMSFAQELVCQIQEQDIEEGSTIEIATIKTEVVEESPVSSEASTKEPWSRRDIIKFLRLYQIHKDEFGGIHKKKWSTISRELARRNIFKSAEKCKDKWKNLMRTYKHACEKPSTSRFHFFQEIDNIINDVQLPATDSENEEYLNNILETDDSLLNNSDASPEPTEKEIWSKTETLKFLQAFQKLKHIKKTFNREIQFWSLIAKELAKDNIYKVPEKCLTKWKNLYRTYKKINASNGSPYRFQYFNEIKDIMNGKEIVVPEHVTEYARYYDNVSEMIDANGKLGRKSLKRTDNDSEMSDANNGKLRRKSLKRTAVRDSTESLEHKEDSNVVDLHEDDSMDDSLQRSAQVCWTGEETFKLISAYKKHKHKFRRYSVKRDFWNLISAELSQEGSQKDADKCKDKWRSLMRAYNRTKNSKRFYFATALDTVFNDDSDEDGSVSEENGEVVEKQKPKILDKQGIENGNENYEEIIIQTELDIKPEFIANTYSWSNSEISSLIQVCAKYKQTFSNENISPSVWEEISRDLRDKNVHKSAESCKQKWCSLFNMYQTHKNLNMGNGKFSFFDSIDSIFKDQGNAMEVTAEEPPSSLPSSKRCNCREKVLADKQKRHSERMQIMKRKLDIEERKVKAFEEYLSQLKNLPNGSRS